MALGLAAALAPVAQAQSPSWPNRPIRLIVPFPPGGGTDAFARPLSKVLSQNLGQQVVIDNRGGAGGTLGAELAAKSPPDGYTFIVGAVHHTIAVSMYPKLGYDLVRDLTPVTVVSYVPNVVVVNPQRVPVKTFAEFQAYVRANPGKLNYGSAGNGTTHHLTVELWKTLTRSSRPTFRTAAPGPRCRTCWQVRSTSCSTDWAAPLATSRPASWWRWRCPRASARSRCPTFPR
jgi:tripartite-type tricarboxylate transporter receptor subunit TctC